MYLNTSRIFATILYMCLISLCKKNCSSAWKYLGKNDEKNRDQVMKLKVLGPVQNGSGVERKEQSIFVTKIVSLVVNCNEGEQNGCRFSSC